ncbi:hypothetical protein [Halobacteriovorax sp. JY17]|uniref:hypothetical protein n=1 Tax=Halobacteriovorax sp. JY17 TaxID=2014617 RepID=UPI000C53D949|nr:hypothetical protein [Halobacteriovorax sp. JY17]PIK16032.1 MAG: hypothetical protein CES88_04695 [Halobacteriovorax sp. JY17]
MKKFLFLTLILIFSACSKKGAGTPAKLRLLSSAITAGLTTAGGAIITGKSSTGEAFQMGLQLGTESTDIELSPGDWEFAAITWENENGLGPLTGKNRCALSNAKIEGEEVVVDLNLSPATCTLSFFSTPENITTDQFNTLRLVACSNLSNIVDDNSSCSSNPLQQGSNLSYRIVFKGMNLSNGAELSSLSSACIKDINLTNSDYITNYKLPLNSNGNFPFLIAAYEGLNCEFDDLESTYLFQASNLTGRPLADSQVFAGPSAGQTSFFFADNYAGIGDNTFANSGMLPPAQTIQYRYDDPTESGGGGDNYQNTREAFNNIVGSQNLTSPWTLGSKAKLSIPISDAADEIIAIESTSQTDIFNSISFNFNNFGSECPTATTFDSATKTFTINYCPQFDNLPTYTTTNDIVNSLNTALTNAGFIPGLTVTNLRPSSNLSGSITPGSTALDMGREAESPWKRNSGLYGEIAGAFHGHLGAILFRAGYETCSEIPTSGSFQYDLGDRDIIEFRFSSGKIPMTSWMTGFGTVENPNIFEKRVAFYEEGQMREFYEFNCTGNKFAGFYRSNHIDVNEDHRVEAYFDAQDSDHLKFESNIYDVQNYGGQNSQRKQWSYLVSDNSVQNVKLWTARYYNDQAVPIEHGDVYAAQITDSLIYTSSKHYDSAQLLSGHIDFETNTDTHQDFSYDGTPSTSTGFTNPLDISPSTLAMNQLQFPKLREAVPTHLAPMSMHDSRLFAGFGPNVTYQAYKRTMDFFDDWNSRLNGVSGCLADLNEVHQFLLGDATSLFPDSVNYVYAHNFTSVYTMSNSFISSNGCTQITWDTSFNAITIDPLSFRNYDEMAAVSQDQLTEGTLFNFSIPTTILGSPQVFTNTLVATSEIPGSGQNKGSLRLFGDQDYEALYMGPPPPIQSGSTTLFTVPVAGVYPGSTTNVGTTGVSGTASCNFDPTFTMLMCTPDGAQATSDVWTIEIINPPLGRNVIETTTITAP